MAVIEKFTEIRTSTMAGIEKFTEIRTSTFILYLSKVQMSSFLICKLNYNM